MKKAILGFVLFIVIVGAYSFWTDFSLVKRLIGYNVPETTDPPIAKPDIDDNKDGLGFLNVPEGFKISVAAKGLTNPRVITFDSKNRMLVSETKAGRVTILEDKDKNGTFDNKSTLIENLISPHGLAFFVEGETTYLYIAETHQVARYAYNDNTGTLIEKIGANIATLPQDGGHFTRTILFGPNWRDRDLVKGTFPIGGFYSNDKLYISVGSSCNVCVENTWKRAAILESDPQGTFTGEFAGGLRNSVFFAFHPVTKEIWATEMGRDNLGDNLPPDEINIVKVAGSEDKFGAKRYGWPFCYGNQVRDKKFNPEKIERIDISS
ncbi:MAG: PQQ-dependent sugar dehydrogenase, partial [bacterium]|nr:PQQ-dependent sugar dehydrogenase [bacterium]